MARHIFWTLVFLQFAIAPVSGQDDRVRNWEADLDFLAEELPKRHKDLFFQLSDVEFGKSIEAIRGRIETSSDQQIQLEFCRLVTAVGDGHTRVNINYNEFEFVPVHFEQFRDGVFVKAAVNEYAELVGGKLISVGDSSVEQVYESMSTLIAHDNHSYLNYIVPFYMTMATMLDFAEVTNAEQPIRLTLLKDGKEQTVELRRVGLTELNELDWTSAREKDALYEQRENEDYWTEWLPESKTVYLKYRRCNNFLKFAGLAGKTMDFINENEVDRLIVDMRLNGGGNSTVMQPFLLAVKGCKLNQTGRLFVVTGRRTFSSAVLNTIDFKQRTNATITGLPTGGKPNHYGEVKNMKLPNSGLLVTYSTNYFEHYKDGNPDTIDPDVEIEPTFEEWAAGEDAVLNYILKQPVPEIVDKDQ